MAKFILPGLPYSYDALEPFIDAKTMEIHHTKHHQTYLDKLNAAVEGDSWFEGKTIEEIVEKWEEGPEGKKDIIRNHGGGHINHSLFWQVLTPKGNMNISKELEERIKTDFGTLDKCIEMIKEASVSHFGSGWGWLVLNKEGKLEAFSTPNQNSPLMYGYKPLLGIDVWEHAYYLKYQNKRPDYLEAIWNVINWEQVSSNFLK